MIAVNKFKYTITVDGANPWWTNSEVSATARLTWLLTIFPSCDLREEHTEPGGYWNFDVLPKKVPQ